MAKDGEKKDSDVEMKERGDDAKTPDESKESEENDVEKKDVPLTYTERLHRCLAGINAGVMAKDNRPILRVLRHLTQLRREASFVELSHLITRLLPNRPLTELSVAIAAEASRQEAEEKKNREEGEKEEDEGDRVKEAPAVDSLPSISGSKAEVEVFLGTLMLIALIDCKKYTEAVTYGEAVTQVLRGFVATRRTIDFIGAKTYFYLARAYELAGRLSELRPQMMMAFRKAALHHDHMMTATLLNLLLRSFLKDKLVEQALMLTRKTHYPDSLRSNAQSARYLYYLGRIHAAQLEYGNAHQVLVQALRKAPQNAGRGFRISVTKLTAVVQLLLGEIPERQLFTQPESRMALQPYEHIVQAVRSGDLGAFREVMEKYESVFEKDDNVELIRRLRHNVIKAGLRKINHAYSHIAIADVAEKLGLESVADAEGIVAKSTLDGVMNATINVANQTVRSRPQEDVYASADPAANFHKRITFCLQLYNEAVKAMQYPEDPRDRAEAAEEKRREHMEHLARVEEEEFGGDDMDYL